MRCEVRCGTGAHSGCLPAASLALPAAALSPPGAGGLNHSTTEMGKRSKSAWRKSLVLLINEGILRNVLALSSGCHAYFIFIC